MNTKILQKCLDELNKEPFKIDKVIGMLETMIEMSEPVPPTFSVATGTGMQNPPYVPISKEDETLNSYVHGPIANLS